MALAEGRSGLQTAGDGTPREIRLIKSGDGAASDSHSAYQEAVLRGGVYGIQTAAAGVVLNLASSGLGAATFQPIVGILNPIGSGVIAVILKAAVGPQATGASASNEGIYVYNISAPNATTTLAAPTIPTSMKTLMQGGSKVIGSLNQAYTGNGQAWVQLKPFVALGTSRFAAPTVSINVNGIGQEEVAGLIQVPPGCALGIGTISPGIAITVGASLIWEEIPQ